jgi:cytochrome oxidase assembly protein ShyY1
MRPFLTPKWILSHVFVVFMVVLMTYLGFWQLNRLAARKDLNAEVRIAMAAEPTRLESLLETDALNHTPVLVAGEYLDELSFFVANRSFDGRAGSWLVTPVRLADGRAVAVSRGWVPRLYAAGETTQAIETPTGQIEVLGRINDSVPDGRIGTSPTAILPEVSRLDLDRVEELLGIEVVDRWVQLERQAPPADDLPAPVPSPGLDEGSHLSYAVQWFFFSSATVVAYFLIIRNRRRERELERELDTELELGLGE